MNLFYLFVINCTIFLVGLGFILLLIVRLRNQLNQLNEQSTKHQQSFEQWLIRIEERERNQTEVRDNISRLLKEHQQEQHQQRLQFDQHQLNSLKLLQESLQKGLTEIHQQVLMALNASTTALEKRVDKFTYETDQRLKEISGQVEKRLEESFNKTTATFTDVLTRLALIDEAQKKITELSGNVISLQEILTDKRSRGAFGEIQLAALVRNVLPERTFAFQHTLSNGKRADCILFLPEPTGNLVVDAKFPLENYRRLQDVNLPDSERRHFEQQFRLDIRRHIQDIASKYIIPGETSDGAMMFLPAEAIFAEIHASYSDIVEFAQQSRIWLVSPTTMMAILTTASAVLKDAATRQQVHIIQEHLLGLSKDFERFQVRMNNLAKHIQQAHSDVEEVHKSSKKITSRFQKIERVEFEQIPTLIQNNLLESDD